MSRRHENVVRSLQAACKREEEEEEEEEEFIVSMSTRLPKT
jgi:hypothetical protein